MAFKVAMWTQGPQQHKLGQIKSKLLAKHNHNKRLKREGVVNIVTSFLTRARSHPELLAVTCAGATLTFAQLAQNAGALAGSLRTGVQLVEGDRVVLFMENRAAFFEALLACWMAGLVPVPVNAKLHPREISVIIKDANAKLVLTSDALRDGLLEPLADMANAVQLVSVQSHTYTDWLKNSISDVHASKPDDVAWLFYTSGTTGAPKGAMLTHRNLLMMVLQYYADVSSIGPGDTMLHAAPLSHASGLYALPHLFAGGHQVIEPGFAAQSVLRALGQYPDVTLFAAPTMLTRLVSASVGIENAKGNLKTICYGGAPMYLNDLLQVMDVFGTHLFAVYGQGESPMTITGLSQYDHQGDGGPLHLARLSSCGTARTGMQVRVVDDDGNELPLGATGEVIVKGDTVMLGYWGNESATSKALRQGWLWTGDIGAFDERGYLTLKDRSKDLIIRGGSNIYPREIEEILLKHGSVAEVSVVGRQHDDLGEEPVAFVVIRDGTDVTERELDELCLGHIARFKRPRTYYFLESLPKSNYGKILKTELRKKLTFGEIS